MSTPTTRPQDVYRRLLSYLTPYRKTFFLALGAMVMYGATDGAVPYLLKRVLDDVFGSQNETMLLYLVGIIMAFAVIRSFFGFFQRYLAAAVGLGIIKDLRNEISEKLLTLSPAFYHLHSTGALISRVTNDTLLVRSALTDATASILRDTVRVIALLIVAFYLDPLLALIAFVGFPLGLYPMIRFGKKVRRLSRRGQDQFGGLTGLLQETIVGHKVVQAFGREGYENERFRAENQLFTDTLLRAEKYGALASPTNEIVASLAIAAVIFYGGFSVISGVRTQGDFIAFVSAMFLLYEPLKKMSRVNNLVMTGVAAAERIFEILDTKADIADAPGAIEVDAHGAAIDFASVSFAYENSIEGEPQLVLRDVSLQIQPGETVALVGASGSGKSTFVNLLPRFYDPNAGRITIGGTDIREVTLASLRRSVAIVSQHTFLFNDTIHHNIAYGRLEASTEEIIEAAKAANAHTFISALPDGYQTVIGEQGLKLSGGQRARIAIARALLKDAPVLILDEATASLDSESEGLVQEAIDHLMQGRTVLVIAHRLATIREANRIAVFSAGRIIELGSHDELLQRGGEYAKLYRLQFREQDERAAETSRLALA
ncbi:MAG: ATP-binding cassette domain-containing protein [Bdellovibrionales bacterium]|nr:ATP-binding cassette domain-containing protein [Bdellovibrionales bacterium]